MSVQEAEALELVAADQLEAAWRRWLRGEGNYRERLRAEYEAELACRRVILALQLERARWTTTAG